MAHRSYPRSDRNQPVRQDFSQNLDSEPDLRTQYGGRGGLRIARVAPWDHALVYITLALVVVGLMSVFTASAAQADLETGNSVSLLVKQLLSTLLGGVVLIWMSQFPFERLKRLSRPFAAISIVLLLLTMVAGTTANGSERWIALPFGFQFQPSDFAKRAA
jgi:cell division protein FtsW (lipid II flippase)